MNLMNPNKTTMSKIINTTPHEIVVYDNTRFDIIARFPASKENELRTKTDLLRVGTLEEKIPLIEFPIYEGITVPDSLVDADVLIVSSTIAPLLVNYDGMVVVPPTDPRFIVKDNKGIILGITAFYLYQRDRQHFFEQFDSFNVPTKEM